MRALSLRTTSLAVAASARNGFNVFPKRFQSEQTSEEFLKLPDDHPHIKQMNELKKDLKETQEKLAEAKKDILYQAAETENARRIGREDVEKARNYGIQSFGKDILEVGDALENAVGAFSKMSHEELDSNKQLHAIYTGLRMCNSVLLKNFSKHGIEKMSVEVGSVFDPNKHEAIFKAPATDKAPPDHITNVVKSGYTLKERILRAAQVGVAEAPEHKK